MGFSRLGPLLLSIILVLEVHSAPHILDATDECILTCDQCYKNEVLLNCANDCLLTEGRIQPHWKLECPLFFSNVFQTYNELE